MNKLTRGLFVACLLMWLFALTARMIHDPDFWWHLKTGELIIQTGSIPHTDPFSHTVTGKAWVAHEWLSEVLMYGVYRASGLTGLIFVFAALTSAAYWITYLRSEGRPFAAGGALLLGAFASSSVWGVRPQMFTLLLTSIFLSILDHHLRGRARTRMLWWLVPSMLLWVNLHGGFALGLALVVLSIAGTLLDGWLVEGERAATVKRLRALVVVLGACLLVVPLNPNGVHMFTYPFETLASPMMQTFLLEWLPPDFRDRKLLPLALLFFATFASLALSPGRARPSDMLVLSALGFAALRSSRHIPFFALAAIPHLAGHAHTLLVARRDKISWNKTSTTDTSTTGQEQRPDARAPVGANDPDDSGNSSSDITGLRAGRFSPATIVLCAATLMVAAACVFRVRQTLVSAPGVGKERLPAEAMEWLRANKPAGPIFHKFEWGGYLMWNLYPDYAVFVDGRSDMYGDDFVLEYIRVSRGEPGWRATLDRYGIRTVLVKPDSALVKLLRQNDEWRGVYEDAHAVVFTRGQLAVGHSQQALKHAPHD